MRTQVTASSDDQPAQGRGQRGPENAVMKHLSTVRDRAATLACDVARLNAVKPNFLHVDKSVESVRVATRWLTKAFDVGIDSAAKKEAYRRELTLEAGYRMILDLKRGVPTIHQDRSIDEYIKKNEAQVRDAYNSMQDRYSMKPEEIILYRSLWLFTALALRRCAIQPYRHKLGRQVFDHRIDEKLDDNDTYYLARVLDSKMAASEPKYHIDSSCFRALQVAFNAILNDFEKVIEAMRKYRSMPALQTIEKRDKLVGALEVIAGALRDLEIAAREAFAKRPAVFWETEDISEIDPYDSKYK